MKIFPQTYSPFILNILLPCVEYIRQRVIMNFGATHPQFFSPTSLVVPELRSVASLSWPPGQGPVSRKGARKRPPSERSRARVPPGGPGDTWGLATLRYHWVVVEGSRCVGSRVPDHLASDPERGSDPKGCSQRSLGGHLSPQSPLHVRCKLHV